MNLPTLITYIIQGPSGSSTAADEFAILTVTPLGSATVNGVTITNYYENLMTIYVPPSSTFSAGISGVKFKNKAAT